MRCFIAIPLPREIKDYLVMLQNDFLNDSALGLGMTPVKDFHLTLKFLGDVEDSKIKLIADSLRKVRFNKLQISLNDFGVFPSESYVRVMWIGLNPEKDIIGLQRRIEESLKGFGFSDEKDFKAHITIARVKSVADKKKLNEKIKSIKIEKKSFAMEDFRLVKSTLTPQGPVYEDLEVFHNKI